MSLQAKGIRCARSSAVTPAGEGLHHGAEPWYALRPNGRQSKAYHQRLEAAMTVTDRIELNPNIMQGKPVIRGTRVTVELVLRKIAEGADEATLLAAYPALTKADIQR
jgi:uncharacterized protein (DUF433 family)